METYRKLRGDVEHGERGGVVEVVEDEDDDGNSDEKRSGLNQEENVADVLVGARGLRHGLRDARAGRPKARRDGRGDGDVDDELDRPADVGQDADHARGGDCALGEEDNTDNRNACGWLLAAGRSVSRLVYRGRYAPKRMRTRTVFIFC